MLFNTNLILKTNVIEHAILVIFYFCSFHQNSTVGFMLSRKTAVAVSVGDALCNSTWKNNSFLLHAMKTSWQQTSKKSQKIDWLTLWCWWLKQSTLSDAPIDCCAGIMESLVDPPDVTIPSALDKVKRLEQSGNMDIELGQCNLPKFSINLRKYKFSKS